MQDHYVADIGDYIKYALLRALAPAAPGGLGVVWYTGPGGDLHNGSHRAYLDRPGEWRAHDPALFDALGSLSEHSMGAVERSGLLPRGTVFAGEPLPARAERAAWFGRVQATLTDCGWVFADPDVGLAGKTALATQSLLHIPLAEALALAAGRPLVVYHHNTRAKGGHRAEVRRWVAQMPAASCALYARPRVPRTFFLLNTTPGIAARAQGFAALWSGKVEWVGPCAS